MVRSHWIGAELIILCAHYWVGTGNGTFLQLSSHQFFFYLFTRIADPSHFGKIRIHRSQHGLIDPDPDEVPSPIITDFQAHNPKYVFYLLFFEVTLFIIPKI